MLNWTGRLILLAVLLLCVGFFGRELYVRIRLIRRGKRDEQRLDRPWERLLFMVVRVGSQLCAVKDRPLVGIMHAFIFWGFVFFTVATINHFVGAFVSGFSLFGRNRFNDLWFLAVEIIAVLTMIGALFMAVRRYLVKPPAITQPQPISRSWQSGVVLFLIFGLMATYLLGQAAEGLLKGEFNTAYMPFTRLCAAWLSGVHPEVLHGWSQFFWWSHILMVLAFLVFIPHSKHLHLIAGPVNIFFRSRKPIGTLDRIDFEKTEEFGVTNITQYQWKNLTDFNSCIDCGRCQDVCPAFLSGKALSPKVVMMSLRKHLLNEKKNLLKGDMPAEPIMDKWLTPDEIWACTTCGACMQVCPVMNEHIPALVELRRAKVMMESDFPNELNAAFRGLETNANPWNMGSAAREDWREGLSVPLMADKKEAEYLWFVGCAGCLDDRAKKISQAMAKILNAAQVEYAILGMEEKCCGDPARRSGNEYVFQMLAEENVAAMKQYRFKQVLTACPHCYHMIKNEYSQFGADFSVKHHSELISELLQNGRLALKTVTEKIAFHDSCYLGRYNKIYDAPRQVVNALQSSTAVEIKRHGEKSFCCGAGGGRMFMEESQGERINHIRTQEIVGSGAHVVATACPFCLAMLDDGIKEKGVEQKLQALDIAQLTAKNM